MTGTQPSKAAECVFAFNRRGMMVNALLAGVLALAGIWGAQRATGGRLLMSLVGSAIMLALCLAALGILLFSSKFVVVVNDLGIHDGTRPWAKRSLMWSDIDTVSVDAFPGMGHVVTIRSDKPNVKPIQISSRHIQSVPEGLIAAIREHPRFVGRMR